MHDKELQEKQVNNPIIISRILKGGEDPHEQHGFFCESEKHVS